MVRRRLRGMYNSGLYALLRIGGPAFADRKYPAATLLRHLFVQKVLRVNSHVPWPVHWTSYVKSPGKIDRGTRCPGLSPGCYIDGRNGIIIGRNVWIGPKVSLISMNHDPDSYLDYEPSPPIVLGDDCWLAAGVTVLAGVRLGNHVVCAAGAVVTRSFPENDIMIAGVPARIVKRLPPYGKEKV